MNNNIFIPFVTFSTAKLLKQAGFDLKTEQWYEVLDNGQVMHSNGLSNNWNNTDAYGDNTISMPTLTDAQKWLESIWGYHIVVCDTIRGRWRVVITKNDDDKYKIEYTDNYYLGIHTIDAAIAKCIKLILKNKLSKIQKK